MLHFQIITWMEVSLPTHAVWCWVNPGGHLQVKPPMVFTHKNWQLCCLVEHSSKSGCQNVPSFIKHYLDSWTLQAATQNYLCSEGMEKGTHLCRSFHLAAGCTLLGKSTGNCPLCSYTGSCMAWETENIRPNLKRRWNTQWGHTSIQHRLVIF